MPASSKLESAVIQRVVRAEFPWIGRCYDLGLRAIGTSRGGSLSGS